MRTEEFGPLGVWALGLLLFIATLIITHWAVEFVTWSTLDSGWAQAIGSVAAILASFFLFKRQRDHELQEAKDEALLRRFLAVQTVADVAYRALNAMTEVYTVYESEFAPGIAPDLAPRLPELRIILDRFAEPTAERIVVLVAMDFSNALVETQADITVREPELHSYVTNRIKERLDSLWEQMDSFIIHRNKLQKACEARGLDVDTDLAALIGGE